MLSFTVDFAGDRATNWTKTDGLDNGSVPACCLH